MQQPSKPAHPTIDDARELGKRYRKRGVIIFHFGERYGFSSYGLDRRRCQALGKIADRFFELLRAEPELLEALE